MMGKRMGVSVVIGLALLMCGNLALVGAQAAAPDMTKFGYATVAKSMDLTPDQAATITMGDQSVAIKAGTFDNPVTFDLLTSDPSQWKDLVKDRTIRAAFAFRITDKTTKALVGALKQPVTYSYSGAGAAATDVILNTTAASPPVISVNAAPITFDGKVNHTFGGAGVGWLVASASTTAAAAGTPAAAGSPAAGAAATTAPRPAATTAPVATGTGGAAAPTTLPKTGEARTVGMSPRQMILPGGGALLVIAGIALLMRRRTAVTRS